MENQQIKRREASLRTPVGSRAGVGAGVAFAQSTESSHHIHRVRDMGAGNMEQALGTNSGSFWSRSPGDKVESRGSGRCNESSEWVSDQIQDAGYL